MFDQIWREKNPQSNYKGAGWNQRKEWEQGGKFDELEGLPLCCSQSFQGGFLSCLHSSTEPFATADSLLVHDWELTYLQSKKRPSHSKKHQLGKLSWSLCYWCKS